MLFRLIFIGLFVMSLIKPNDWLLIFFISVGVYELYYLLMILIPKPNKQLLENNYLNKEEFDVLKKYYNFFQFPVHSKIVSFTFIFIFIELLILIVVIIFKKFDFLTILFLFINLFILTFLMRRLDPIHYAKNASNGTNMKQRLPTLLTLYNRIHILDDFSVKRSVVEYPLIEYKRDVNGSVIEKICQYSNGRKVATLYVTDNRNRYFHLLRDFGNGNKDYRKFYINELEEIHLEIEIPINPKSNIYELYEILLVTPEKFNYKQYAYIAGITH